MVGLAVGISGANVFDNIDIDAIRGIDTNAGCGATLSATTTKLTHEFADFPDALTDTEARIDFRVGTPANGWCTPGNVRYQLNGNVIIPSTQPGGTSAYALTADAPKQPVLTATSASQATAALSWSDDGEGVTYEVDRAVDSGPFLLIAVQPTTTFTDGGMLPNHTFQYRVIARSASGASPYSQIAHVTTSAAASIPVDDSVTSVSRTIWRALPRRNFYK
jgi:hypothetical protein